MGRPRKGTVQWRGGRWWGRFTLRAKGGRSPEFEVPAPADGGAYDEAYAESFVARAVQKHDATGWVPRSRAATPAQTTPAAVPTVLAFALEWIKTQTHVTAKDERGYLANHLAASTLGAMRLDQVTPGDVVEFIEWLKARPSRRDGRPIAARYVRTIYDVVRRAFERAALKRHIAATPCVGVAKYLPAVEDKDPGARAGWKLARHEVVALLADPRVPPDRRVLYALAFYTGARIGEVAALRWAAYEPDAPVLGRLTIAVAYNRRTKRVEGTKTRATKLVPVHPALAAVLAAWKADGWRKHQRADRDPEPGDLVVPSKLGRERGVYGANEAFGRDCTKLGIVVRHQHCTRHTFISLAIDDGARGEVLKRVTHARPREQFDQYTQVDWAALCSEVAKLHLPVGSASSSASSSASAPPGSSESRGADAAEGGVPNRIRSGGPGGQPSESVVLSGAVESDDAIRAYASPSIANTLAEPVGPPRDPVAGLYARWAAGAIWPDDHAALAVVPS